MNRFKIVIGKEKAFEDVWKNRETHLENFFDKLINWEFVESLL